MENVIISKETVNGFILNAIKLIAKNNASGGFKKGKTNSQNWKAYCKVEDGKLSYSDGQKAIIFNLDKSVSNGFYHLVSVGSTVIFDLEKGPYGLILKKTFPAMETQFNSLEYSDDEKFVFNDTSFNSMIARIIRRIPENLCVSIENLEPIKKVLMVGGEELNIAVSSKDQIPVKISYAGASYFVMPIMIY